MIIRDAYRTENRDSLQDFIAPRPTNTFAPVGHYESAQQIADILESKNIRINKEIHEVSKGGNRLFSKFFVSVPNINTRYEYEFVVGHRNTHDKSAMRGVVLGKSVVVCKNMCFSGEMKLENKHTNGVNSGLLVNFDTKIAQNISTLIDGFSRIHKRVETLKKTEINNDQANEILVEGFMKDILPASKFTDVVNEYRNPRHAEFKGNTLWNMENAFTEFFREVNNPHLLPVKSEHLNRILDKHIPEYAKAA